MREGGGVTEASKAPCSQGMLALRIYNGLREVSVGVLYGEGRRSEGLKSSPEDKITPRKTRLQI